VAICFVIALIVFGKWWLFSAGAGPWLRLCLGGAFFYREEPAGNFHASAVVVHSDWKMLGLMLTAGSSR